jgi:hypothetical protein
MSQPAAKLSVSVPGELALAVRANRFGALGQGKALPRGIRNACLLALALDRFPFEVSSCSFFIPLDSLALLRSSAATLRE